jgi:outer membrane protein OmpA-like peptidoglycan-associated protein
MPSKGAPRSWRLEITDTTGKVVKSYGGGSEVPESVFWDGRDESGVSVANASACRFSLWVTEGGTKEGKSSEQRSVVRQPFTIRSAQGAVQKISGLWFRLHDVDVDPEIESRLAEIARLIKRDPAAQVTIQGHAYREGQPEDMLRLSQERADAVLRYLIEVEGVSPRNLSAIGYSDSMPLEAGSSDEIAARNRRVDVLIISK